MIAPWQRRGELKSRPRGSPSIRESPCWWSPDITAQTWTARRGLILGRRRRRTAACWGPTLTRPQVARRGPNSVFALRYWRLSLSFCRTHTACVFEFGSKIIYLFHVGPICWGLIFICDCGMSKDKHWGGLALSSFSKLRIGLCLSLKNRKDTKPESWWIPWLPNRVDV